jgi:hypothetical protein
MDPSTENKEELNKKLLDDKERVSETFCCLSSCCFLLYA